MIELLRGSEVLRICKEKKQTIGAMMLERETELQGKSKQVLLADMQQQLTTMRLAIKRGPVSYTHLPFASSPIISAALPLSWAMTKAWRPAMSVSYTHLAKDCKTFISFSSHLSEMACHTRDKSGTDCSMQESKR